LVDDIITITEPELKEAMTRLLVDEHLVVEGAGAAATAAVLAGRLDVRGQRVSAIVSGANVDGRVLRQLLHDRE
jgi:threonine dehydratase